MIRYLYILIFVLLYTSCKKEDEIRGPQISVVSDNFQLIESFKLSDSPVNFGLYDTVHFSALFNEKVSYEVNILGLESGAVKSFSGTANALNIPWIGDADNIFFKNEDCIAQLYLVGKDIPAATINFSIANKMFPNGNLISDFEPSGPNALQGFWEPPINGKETRLFTGRIADYAIQGDYSYKMSGINYLKELPRNFLGLVYTKPIVGINGINKNGAKYNVGSDKASEVWFNIWIYGNGTNNSFLAIKFMQDDNGDGDHQGDMENGYEYIIENLSHRGWKLFSVRYDQLSTSGNKNYGGNGDKIHRPDQIATIEFAMWSKASNVPLDIIFDYPIFTLNKPLGK